MDDYTKGKIETGKIVIPNGWTVIDTHMDITMNEEHMYWHWPDKTFRMLDWWKNNDPISLELVGHKITQSMIAIKKIEPKIYVPEKPEKSKVMRNIRSLVKR